MTDKETYKKEQISMVEYNLLDVYNEELKFYTLERKIILNEFLQKNKERGLFKGKKDEEDWIEYYKRCEVQ